MDAFNEQIKKDIEAKYAKKRQQLVFSLERAKSEDRIHRKEEGFKKYDRLWDIYADFDPAVQLRDAKHM